MNGAVPIAYDQTHSSLGNVGERERVRVSTDVVSPVFRAQLEAMLRDEARFETVSIPRSAGPKRKFPSRTVDVILTDSWDNTTGFPSCGELPIVLLSENVNRFQLRSLGDRVFGVLPRSATAAQICAAIQAAASGLITMPREEWQAMIPTTGFDEEEDDIALEALTPREAEVLALMARGLGNKDIAARLKISEHTAKFHVSSILSKLNAATRTEAVMKGLRDGLLVI